MCAVINSLTVGDVSLIRGDSDTIVKSGGVMKQGKSALATRWMVLVGPRLLVFRDATEKGGTMCLNPL